MKKMFLTLAVTFMGITGFAQQPDKMYTSENSAAFAKTIANPTVQLVDVRTPKEFDAGHIPGAINIDAQNADFEKHASTMLDKKRPVALYCKTGARSKMAAEKLTKHGYKVYELEGGISQWKGKMTDAKQMVNDKMHDTKKMADDKMHDAKKMGQEKVSDTKNMMK